MTDVGRGMVRWRRASPRRPRGHAGGPRVSGRRAGCRAGHPHDGASCPVCRDASDPGRWRRPLVGRDAGAVQTGPLPVRLVGVVPLVGHRLVEPIPDPGCRPVPEPPPARHARSAAECLGQHLPGNAALEDKADVRQAGAIRNAWPTALRFGWRLRQERFDAVPAFVSDQWWAHTTCGGKPDSMVLLAALTTNILQKSILPSL
jgi:hypothetical protein